MTLLFLLLVLAVVGVIAAVAAGRITGGLDAPASSLPARGLPAGPVGASELDAVRFSPALRGYRMHQVDEVMDRLVRELEWRDEELARLRALAGDAAAAHAREPLPPGDGPLFPAPPRRVHEDT